MQYREFKPDEWVTEIFNGLEYRRKFGIESVWGELEAIFYNVHPSMANDGPNLFLSTGDTLLSDISTVDPRYIVRPDEPEAVYKAPLVESLDNKLLRDLGIKFEIERMALHTYLFGRGFLKCGYDSEFGYDPSLDVGGVLRMGLTFSQYDIKGKRRIEHDSGVAPGMPWVRATPPHDVVVPWGTTMLENCPWIAHRICRQFDDLKADRKYTNTQRLVPTYSMADFVQTYKAPIRIAPTSTGIGYGQRWGQTGDSSSRENEFIEFWEIMDKRTGRIYCVVPGHQTFIRNEQNALQIENRLPWVSTAFTPGSRAFWVTPDTYYLRHAQMELCDIAIQRQKQRRISGLKFLYDEDAISEEELAKVLSPEVGVAAKVTGGGDISRSILALGTNTYNQALMLEEREIRDNLREQIGFSRNQVGQFVGGRRTATEANIVNTSSSKRMSRRGLTIKRAFEDTIEIVNSIVFSFWTLPRYIEIAGAQKGQEWQQVIGSNLRSRFAYSVEFSNEEEFRQRRIEALQMYMTLSQDPSVDPAALRQFLTDAYADPSFARLFNADVQNAMRALRLFSGAVQPEGRSNSNRLQSHGVSALSQLPPPSYNGQGSPNGAASTLAG